MARKQLPEPYEDKYKSESLKEKIAERSIWTGIPGVNRNFQNAAGRKRIRDNDLLFSFIDQYFPDFPYAFEPNMQDGRFVFLPYNVHHQGIGIAVSKDLPNYFEVAQFWYPGEFTRKPRFAFATDQTYVPAFSTQNRKILVDLVERVYMDGRTTSKRYCTFPFTNQCIVTLKGNFLDHMQETEKTIRDALKKEDPSIQRNGEALIAFMHKVK